MKFNTFKKTISIILSFVLLFGLVFLFAEKNHNLNINNQNITTNSLNNDENFDALKIKDVSIPFEKIDHDGFDVKFTLYGGSWRDHAIATLVVVSNDVKENYDFDHEVAQSQQFNLFDDGTFTKHVSFSNKLSEDDITYHNLEFYIQSGESHSASSITDLSVARPKKVYVDENSTISTKEDTYDPTKSSIKTYSSNDKILNKTVGNLSKPEVLDMKITTAKVKTTVSEGSFNGDYSDYSLAVYDKDNLPLGSTAILTEGGDQTINLTGLKPGKEYTGNTVVAYDEVTNEKVKLATSPEFDFTTNYHIMDGISSSSIDDSKEVTDNSFFIKLKTVIGEDDKISDEFKEYNIVVTADHGDLKNDVIFSLNNQTDFKNDVSIEVNGLVGLTRYSNIKVKLVDSETSKTLGNESPIDGEIITTGKVEIKIDNAIILTSTEEGFNFKISVSNLGIGDTFNYKINALSDVELDDGTIDENKLIWSSEKESEIIKDKTFQVTGLEKRKIYNNIRFQLVNNDDDSIEYSDVFTTNIKISPTESKPILSQNSSKVTQIRKKSFDFSISVDGTIYDDEYSTPYKIAVFANGNTITPIWISEELIKTDNDMIFTINGFKPGQELTKVVAFLVDINTYERIPPGNPGEISDKIKMKNLIGKNAIIVIYLTLLSVVIFLLTKLLLKFRKGDKYWRNKILEEEYIKPIEKPKPEPKKPSTTKSKDSTAKPKPPTTKPSNTISK